MIYIFFFSCSEPTLPSTISWGLRLLRRLLWFLWYVLTPTHGRFQRTAGGGALPGKDYLCELLVQYNQYIGDIASLMVKLHEAHEMLLRPLIEQTAVSILHSN